MIEAGDALELRTELAEIDARRFGSTTLAVAEEGRTTSD